MPDQTMEGAISPTLKMDEAAERMKEALEPLAAAIETAPVELLQDLADANLNAHHALGRLNSARAMMQRFGRSG